MGMIKRSIWVILVLCFATIIVACGSASTGTGPYGAGNTSANPAATTTSSSSGGPCGRYCAHPATPTAQTSGSSVSIKMATATVGGKSVTILTNTQGLTLYYRTGDSASSVCDSSNGCSSSWPPLLSTSVPAVAGSLPGKLTVQTNANGSQVEYNGHPLYTFSGDSAAGQMNGQGLGGVWFVVTTDLPV
jgi:predicted lipoprotein with Yx(FWY)xxD motif